MMDPADYEWTSVTGSGAMWAIVPFEWNDNGKWTYIGSGADVTFPFGLTLTAFAGVMEIDRESPLGELVDSMTRCNVVTDLTSPPPPDQPRTTA